MESSIRTGQFEPALESELTHGVTSEIRPVVPTPIGERCSACAAPMATDQRYCVECGRRRGPARVPSMDVLGPSAKQAPPVAPRDQRRAGMSVNSTLVAVIGTLLLALGVGVLIGRSGNSTTTKTPPAQIVTVAGAGTAPSSTAALPATSATTTPAKSAGSHGAAKSTSKAAKKKKTVAPPKTVKVGSPGHGAGYQNGHFTGNFFGE